MKVTPPIPALSHFWDAVRRMCDSIRRQFGPPRAMPLRPSRVLRADLNDWIAPVEKLLRHLIITEACRFLLMTPEGRRMREQARTRDWPATAPAPDYVQTEQKDAAAAQAHRPRNQDDPFTDEWPTDPTAINAPFRVLGWTAPLGQVFVSGARNAGAGEDAADLAPRKPAYRARMHRIARRFEAVLRVIGNPGKLIEQTAACLAGLPSGAFEDVMPTRIYNPVRWPHGSRDVAEATWHLAAATRAWVCAHDAWLHDRAPPASYPDTS